MLLGALDLAAQTWFVGAWVVYSIVIRRFANTGRSLSSAIGPAAAAMDGTMARRDLRMPIDTGIMGGLQERHRLLRLDLR